MHDTTVMLACNATARCRQATEVMPAGLEASMNKPVLVLIKHTVWAEDSCSEGPPRSEQLPADLLSKAAKLLCQQGNNIAFLVIDGVFVCLLKAKDYSSPFYIASDDQGWVTNNIFHLTGKPSLWILEEEWTLSKHVTLCAQMLIHVYTLSASIKLLV